LSDRVTKIGAMENYTYRAGYSPESGQYVGMCLEFPSRYARAVTPHEAIAAVQQVIGEEIAELIECGLEPPPFNHRPALQRQVRVRTSPELHSRLMVDPAEQGVSFNQWVVQKLAGRNPPTLHDLF
jgi:predicted RNase H-like HicB family nuclease